MGETDGDLPNEEKKEFEEAKIWVRKRTPLIKYYSCEAYTHISQKALQVLGGYGFIREYPLERLHRDSFAPLLYEGTSQIQALMAMKDLLKYSMKDPKRFFKNIFFKHPRVSLEGKDWERDFKKTHYRFKKKMIKLLLKTLNPPKNAKILKPKEWMNEERVNELMIHAETLCQASSYMETLRVLVDHANKDKERKNLYYKYSKLVLPRLESIYKDWDIK
jgi:hypothetical protein